MTTCEVPALPCLDCTSFSSDDCSPCLSVLTNLHKVEIQERDLGLSGEEPPPQTPPPS
ncbi:hypothetical protein PDJAM_G00166410 [Pangasius djambal]|uniref:Uncharacterized protein n=1 Tax=Pangasius djambal TaxID=1691987 RepID=A0ACC5ZLC1_9TELE|nr:hypothetical protein [Pangasius djambal]